MPEQKNPYLCECGGYASYNGVKDGYPSVQCPKCGKRWWLTTCWAHVRYIFIDERFAKKCGKCGWYKCPECDACGCQRSSPLSQGAFWRK